MAKKKDILLSKEGEEINGSSDHWNVVLFKQLRKDLIPQITDDKIYLAIDGYRNFMIDQMLKSGEIKKLNKGKNIVYKYSDFFWLNEHTQGVKYSEEELEIIPPEPGEDLYENIVIEIWKQHVKEATWTAGFWFGPKSIKRDKRYKLDDQGLSVKDHALIFYYADKWGCFGHDKEEKEKINFYIKDRNVDTKYDPFKGLIHEYSLLEDRCKSPSFNTILPFLHSWFGSAVFLAYRDNEDCLRKGVKRKKRYLR